MLTAPSETTVLLGSPEPPPTEDRRRPSQWNNHFHLQRVVLYAFACIALLLGWKNRHLRADSAESRVDESNVSADISASSSSTSNLDRASFDKLFHTWESNLYKRTQLEVPLVGSAKFDGGNALILVDDDDDDDDSHPLIYLNHTEAFDLFLSTKLSLTRDFYYYQQGWDAQINQAYCAVASSMAAINSLRGKLTLPEDPVYVPYPWASQTDLINNECVSLNLYDADKLNHKFWGVGLEMATVLLNCHLQTQGWKATPYEVDPSATTLNEIRSTFIDALHDENTRLLINYDRGGITQGPMGHGHFSPIGAYSDEKDAFLVMDVAKYKYPPVWVPTSKLMGGIGSLDTCAFFNYPNHPIDITYPTEDIFQMLGCQAMYRGYILITKDAASSSEI